MHLRRRLSIVGSVALSMAASSLALEAGMLPGQMWFVQATEQSAELDAASVLVLQHGCWSGNPPLDMVGKIPGHVVIRFTGGEPRVAGTRAVGIALEHIFHQPDPRVAEVYAFCR
jgi:hypothetical protein